MISTHHIQVALGAYKPPMRAAVTRSIRVLDKGDDAPIEKPKKPPKPVVRTELQTQIILLTTEGLSNGQIAKELGVRTWVVEKQSRILMKRHGVKSRAEFWKLRFPEVALLAKES